MTDNVDNIKTTITAASLRNHYEDLCEPTSFIPARSIASSTYVTTQPEFNKTDYYNGRPSQSIAQDINAIMAQCEDIYWKTGALRSIVEFISEFIVDGLELVHEDESIQNFYRTWARKTLLVDRAEQFCRHLYRSGNVIVRRYTSEITVPERNQMMDNVLLASYNKLPKKKRGEIPVKYVFYKPSAVKLVGDAMGAWSEEKIYGLDIPSKDFARLSSPRTDLEKEVWESIPKEVKESLKQNQSFYIRYPLPKDKIYVAHYKKDDSEVWAYPLIYAVLQTLLFNQNLLMAKTASLEGWHNLIRIWKLGDHTQGILPPKGAANKLTGILENNIGGGKMDLIWDSMISMEEYYPPVEKLAALQEDKSAILLLFGIPEELAGGIMDKSGSNSSSIRLKNFAKKLDAGRREVKTWILNEIDMIHRNMGFETRPHVRFNNDDLMDEKVYYDLLRELSDRNILSAETLLERIEEVPSIERARIKKRQEMIDSGELPSQASPFHNPNLEVQAELDMKKMRFEAKNATNEVNKKVDSGKNGRPYGVKDGSPRKRGNNKVNKAELLTYGNQLLDFIDKKVTSLYLETINIDNCRQLTNDQKNKLDGLKTTLFASINPGTPINDDIIRNNIDKDLVIEFNSMFLDMISSIPSERISLSEKNILKVNTYAELWSNLE